MKFGPVVKEMLFKNISYLELWQPFCSAEPNNVCNFGKGYYEEQIPTILKNYFEFGPLAQETYFKDISYLELCRPFCSAEQNHLCKGNNSVVQEQMSFK